MSNLDSRTLLHRLLDGCRPEAVRAIRAGIHILDRLPFRRIWCVDTEFRAVGDPHHVWCVCGLELRTGARFAWWVDGYDGPPPFASNDDTLFVAFAAGAEVACWKQLSWPLPAYVFDVFQESRIATNTGRKSDPRSLIDACKARGIDMLELETKKRLQTEAMTRLVWSGEDRQRLTDYCAMDTAKLAQLFLATLPDLVELNKTDLRQWLYDVLMRGECAAAYGLRELRGIPVNAEEWRILEAGSSQIFPAMVESLVPELREVFDLTPSGPVFRPTKFEQAMEQQGLIDDFPRTPLSGRLRTTRDVLAMMFNPIQDEKKKANLLGLAEAILSRSSTALLQWQVGADGRCRTFLAPGATATARCAPSSSRFPFSAPKMFRHAIQAEPGWVVVQADYAGQECAILAEQAQDPGYIAACETDDVHLATAKTAGLVPAHATAETHGRERKMAKAVNFAIAYGGLARRIAQQLGVDEATGQFLLRTHRRVFHPTHDYLERCVDTADEERRSTTQDGWSKRIVAPFLSTVAQNFGVQATAAAMLRRDVVFFERASLPLIATVHDSAVFLCRIEEAAAVLLEVERIMVEVASYFCPGVRMRVDFSASVPLFIPGRGVSPLAEAKTRDGYDRVLRRARFGASRR